MRILLDYRPALRQRTGVGEFVHQLGRALAQEFVASGDELAVFTTSWKDRPSPTLTTELPGASIVHRRLPVRPLTWAWNRHGWPPVEWIAGPADVVHAQSPLLIPTRHAAQVVTIHDLHFLARPDRSTGEMRRDFPALVHQHAHAADHIVVSSQYAASEVVRQLDVSPQRVTVCPPGVPSWASDVLRERAGDIAGAAILYLGTLEARKNIGGLLEAYARLRSRRPDAPPLVLAGQVTPSVQRDLERIARPPLADHVTVLGYVTEEERRRLYAEARMLVLASFEEGFGLPVLEAMACGVPVVVSNRGSLPEVVGTAACPVNPDDHDAIAAEMERLLDPGAARAASAEGLAQATRYRWVACARAAREAYRSALATRAERRA